MQTLYFTSVEAFIQQIQPAGALQAIYLRGSVQFSFENMRDSDVIALADFLQSGNCPTNLRINIEGNSITGEGILALAEAFRSKNLPQGLQVNMGDNGLLMQETAEEIAAVVRENTAITYLRIECYEEGEEQTSFFNEDGNRYETTTVYASYTYFSEPQNEINSHCLRNRVIINPDLSVDSVDPFSGNPIFKSEDEFNQAHLDAAHFYLEHPFELDIRDIVARADAHFKKCDHYDKGERPAEMDCMEILELPDFINYLRTQAISQRNPISSASETRIISFYMKTFQDLCHHIKGYELRNKLIQDPTLSLESIDLVSGERIFKAPADFVASHYAAAIYYLHGKEKFDVEQLETVIYHLEQCENYLPALRELLSIAIQASSFTDATGNSYTDRANRKVAGQIAREILRQDPKDEEANAYLVRRKPLTGSSYPGLFKQPESTRVENPEESMGGPACLPPMP